MRDYCPSLMTLREIAEEYSVGEEEVALWARAGFLAVDFRAAAGPLFHRWRVKRDIPRLAAGETTRIVRKPNGPRSRSILLGDPIVLACGCSLPSAADAAEHGLDPGRPIFACGEARSLQATARLCAVFVAAAPTDPFFARLAAVAAEAFDRHVGTTGHAVPDSKPAATSGASPGAPR